MLRQEILQFDTNGYANVPQVDGYRVENVIGSDDNWHIELYAHGTHAIARRSVDHNILIKDGTLTVDIFYVS